MTRASNQYCDEGDVQPPPHPKCSRWGRDRPLGQLSLAHRKICGAKWEACASLDIMAFPLPADPAQPAATAGEETLWKLVDVNITSCPVCACVVMKGELFFFPPIHHHPPFFFLAWVVIWLPCLLISNKRSTMVN